MADWLAIKTEYITTNTSYRKLAQKYGVVYSVIGERARAEGWVEQRKQYRDKTITKTIEKVSSKQVKKLARIDGIADKLLAKLEKAVDELDLVMATKKVKVEEGCTETTTEYREVMKDAAGVVDRAGLKQIASALRDIKEVQMLRTELDRQEQEARIANLKKQADKDDDTADVIEVVFAAGPEEWNE